MTLKSLAVLIAVFFAGCSSREDPAKPAEAVANNTAAAAETPAAAPAAAPTGTTTMPLQKIDLVPGTGVEIQSGQSALVNYTGWLYEAAAPDNKGKQFDSSEGGEPFEFPVGGGVVIKGWDQGVVGMKVGGKRRLVIPPELGYGSAGAGGGIIPPGATLVFDVELVEIR